MNAVLNRPFWAIFFLLGFLAIQAGGQESEQVTLEERFTRMVESSGRYKEFRVVPSNTLNAFKKSLRDSSAVQQQQLQKLNKSLREKDQAISGLETEKTSLEVKLAESEELNDSMVFLGTPISKGLYNVLIWGVILLLLIATTFMYFKFRMNNSTTQATKRDLAALTEELETYKIQAQEKQVKLKRELQTAINKLAENGIA